MNQRELADNCLMDVTTMSRTLDRMEKEDLVRRERNPQSRRSWNIALTKSGAKKAEEVFKIFKYVDTVIYQELSEDELKLLTRITDKVEKNLWEAIEREEENRRTNV